MTHKLYAVYLGGSAPKANTELHDIVFVVGARVEDTWPQLLDKWFGDPRGLHMDSWWELDVVDGWRVSLSVTPAPAAQKLWFVNLGGYDDRFTELHACGFYVAATADEAIKRAKREMLNGAITVHRDDLMAVDDVIAVETANSVHVVLTYTGETSATRPVNGYQPIPKDMIAAYLGSD